jgi:hypothetical protein
LRSRATLGFGLGAIAAGVGASIGSGVLSDNSFLTHLATGRLIVDGTLPRTDPYTFTAAGESWVVQSWLASALYGLLEDLGGLEAIRLLMVATCAALGAITWALTHRAPSLLVRLGLTSVSLYIGSVMWPHRPLLLGLVFLGVALLAAEGRMDPRPLLAVGWLWVNVHGSWPMGLVALGCFYVGARLDGDEALQERRSLLWLGGGMALGVLNPYGPALLLFPVHLLSRRESLEGIVEWQAIDFSRATDWAFLLLLVVGIVGIRRNPSWRATIPLAVFGVAAITGLRNVPVTVLVVLPGLAAGFADVRAMAADRQSPLGRPLAALGVVMIALSVMSVGRTQDFADDSYPVAADRWLQDNDLHPASHRIVAREIVGNFFEARYGATGTVFMDDRIEVIPPEVVADHRLLLRGEPGWDEALERYEPDAVLWEVDSALAQLLERDDDWTITYEDDDWLVAVPAG